MTTRRTIGHRLLLLGVLTLGAPTAGEAQPPVLSPSPEPLLVSGPPAAEPADGAVQDAPAARASGASRGGTSWSWWRILAVPFWLPAQAILYGLALPLDLLALPGQVVQWAVGGKPCWYTMTHVVTRSPSPCYEPSPAAAKETS